MKSDAEITDELRARGEQQAEPGAVQPKPRPKLQDVGLAPTSEDTSLGPTEAGLLQGGEHKQPHPADKK